MAKTEKTIRKTHTTYSGPDDLFTVPEQIDQCCEEVDVDVCADVGKTEIYTAADSEKWAEKLEERKAKHGNIRSIVVKTVGPGGPCGKKYTEWEEDNDCCDGVTELEWDYDNSVEVGSGVVKVTGGKSPYNWSIRGNGFTFSNGQREIVTDGPLAIVVLDDEACGSGSITIEDGCSVATGAVRSTIGQWTPTTAATECLGGSYALISVQYPYYNYEGIAGKYKHHSLVYHPIGYGWWEYPSPPCSDSQVSLCAEDGDPAVAVFNATYNKPNCSGDSTYWTGEWRDDLGEDPCYISCTINLSGGFGSTSWEWTC